jgi:hypothetical protein
MLQFVVTVEGYLLHEGVAESAAEKKIHAATHCGEILRLLATDLLTTELDSP